MKKSFDFFFILFIQQCVLEIKDVKCQLSSLNSGKITSKSKYILQYEVELFIVTDHLS